MNGYEQQQYGTPYYGQQVYAGGYPQMQPMFRANNFYPPKNLNALTPEEINILKNKPNKNNLDMNISQEDMLRAICYHAENGVDVCVELSTDPTKVYCPICGAIFSKNARSKEELEELVNEVEDQMQIIKWIGEIPIETGREYFGIIPLLKKLPSLAEFASRNFNKYFNRMGYSMADDTSAYAQWMSMSHPYTNTFYNQPYYQQPYQQYNMGMTQPYATQPQQPGMQQGMPANPNVNPMQAPMGSMPQNTQFTDQNNMMMNGGYYQQPQFMNQPMAPNPAAPVMPQQPYQPVFTPATPVAQQTQQAQPQAAPQQEQKAKSETVVDI